MIIAAKLMLVYKKGPTTMNYKNSCPVSITTHRKQSFQTYCCIPALNKNSYELYNTFLQPKTLQKQTKISNEFP